MKHTFHILFASILVAAFGCTSPVIGEDGTVSGIVEASDGHDVPSEARIKVVWVVTSGSPDYNYAFGDGTVTGDAFELPLSEDPPAEALNVGLGVGVVALMTSPPEDGRIVDEEEDDTFASLIGYAPRYAIIYKASEDAGSVFRSTWPELFPVGYSCGVGVDAPEDETFDSYEPVDCSEVEILVDDLEVLREQNVNWT